MGKLPIRELPKRHVSPSKMSRKAKAAAKAEEVMEEKERSARKRNQKDESSNR